MSRIDVYALGSKEKGSVSFPKSLVGDSSSKALLAQAVHVYRDRKHAGLSEVKTRGEIIRTKAKWYRQKGTGRARHGSRNAPIFVGGGVAHGPKGVKRELTLPTKMRRGALSVALAVVLESRRVAAIDGVSKLKSTKEANALLRKACESGKKCLVVLSADNWGKNRLFGNISNTSVIRMNDLNAYDVFYGGQLVFDKEALK